MAAPHRTDTAHPVRASFSHSRHLARGDGGCGPCHDAVQTTADNEVPPPTMATCADCHDGDKAFSVVTAECRRCHTEPPPREPYRKPLGPRFSHRLHADRGMALACDACHRLDPQGRPLPPAPNHAPCSNAGCHRDQFFAAKPRICGACHLGTEPWRPLHRDRPSRPNTEFGARFSHRQHRVAQTANAPNLPAAARGPGLPCTRCHGDMDSRWRSRVPGEHTSCSGDGCHALTGGPAPALTACDDCHVAGLRATRAADRAATRASVRAAFDHAQHRTTPGAQPRPVPCVRCHASVADADTIAVPTPAKDTCIGCHDGRAAFKLTGHGCARCHRPASRGR
jgi:c(7)-type cytochrome triheme protein